MYFFYNYNSGIPDIERSKGRVIFSEASHKDFGPKVSGSFDCVIFNFNVYIFLWLAFLKINSWPVQVVYCGRRDFCACCECVCQCNPVARGCFASRACTSVWLGTGFCHGWVEGKHAAVFCRCGWKMEWKVLAKWNVFCILSQLHCTVIKQWTDESRGRRAISWREDKIHFKEGGDGGQEWRQYESEIGRWERSQR